MNRIERSLQRRLRRQARRAFSPVALERFCVSDDFDAFGQRTEIDEGGWITYTRKGKEFRARREPEWYIHQDNGSSILGVAHLDTVQDKRFCHVYDSNMGKIVKSPALDDRLGAYVICDLLPRMGLNVDWLLTTGEEQGRSTAEHFTTGKRYDWIFSFDRGGSDVVMYDYDTDENRQRLSCVNARVGAGSFSDIAFLTHLGIAGFNWGVGYRDYHSTRSWAPLEDTFASVARFLSFVEKFGGQRIEHVARPRWWVNGWGDQKAEFDDWADDVYEGICPACAAVLVEGFCENCAADWADFLPAKRSHGLTEAEWRALEENVS